MKLDSKNILFISPEFFGVDASIINELKNRGASVTWIDERSVKSSFCRALNSITSVPFYFHSNKYFEKKIGEITINIDVVLVIKGEMISTKIIELIRNKWPKVQLILYFYDPIANIKGILPKIQFYDRIISFDPKDCKRYGFEFRPLFSDFEAKNIADVELCQRYDVCFYGTMYGDRFSIISQMKKYCAIHKLSFYSFCYLRGKFMAFYYWITNSGFRKLGIKEISFVSKPSTELASIVRNSKVILDVNDRKQQGLTIRTLETLLSGKKMITTNKDVVNYDFYNPHNICIIDRENLMIPDEFFEQDYMTIDENVLYKYTAKGWVDDVFGK